MVLLHAKLEECKLKADALSGEDTKKAAGLEKAELAQLSAARKSEALDVVICILRSEWESALETVRLREERLDERIGSWKRGFRPL